MMNICLIHGKRVGREVLARALTSELGAEVTHFPSCESALACSLDCDVFVVYNNFRRKMSGIRGVKEIRARKPDAFIVGVSSTPGFDKRFLPAGADAFVLRAGNEIEELRRVIRQKVSEKQPLRDRPIATQVDLTDVEMTEVERVSEFI
jgi:DNA-binding NarL/FixJ family response regulator